VHELKNIHPVYVLVVLNCTFIYSRVCRLSVGCYYWFVGRAGFESYLAADAISKSVHAVNQTIVATTENPNATANVKVLVETIQKVDFCASSLCF